MLKEAKTILLTAAVCGAVWTLPRARAQNVAESPAPMPPIGAIEIVNASGGVSDGSFVRAHISSREGAALDPNIVAADVRTLLDSGRFSYVATRVAETNGTATLAFVVDPRARLAPEVEFEGLSSMWESTAREAFGLKAGSFVDEQIVEAAVARLKKKYREERKRPGTEVTARITPLGENADSGFVSVTVAVAEADKERTRLIGFTGNKSIRSRDLRRFSGQSPWWNPSGWFTDDRLSDFDLELMKADITRQYHDRGMLDVEVIGPRRTSERGSTSISFEINEGQVYRVGSVGLRGVTLFPEDDVLKAARLRRGDVAGAGAIERARTFVEDYFTSRGYVDTRVATLTYPDEQDAGVLHVAFSVREGALARVGNIHIRGNTTTKDKVIRHEISLNPGDIFDGVAADRSRRRLQNLGYFDNVRFYDVKLDDGSGMRDLVFDMDERSTGSMMIGAGFSSVDHLIGMFEISQSNFDITNWRNFRGGGQKARMSLQVSSESTDLETSWAEPWFLDRRLELDVNAFVRNRSYSEYDTRNAGGSVGLAKFVPWVGRVGLTYTLQDVRLSDVIEGEFPLADDPGTLFSFKEEDDSYMLGSMRLSWVYDTRDRPMIPTSGTRATFFGTLNSELFGGDFDFYELDLRAKHHIPLWYGHVLSFSARAAVVDGYNGDDVPIGSRYFMGGGRNTRGFRYRNIGPKALRGDPAASGLSPPLSTSFHSVGGRSLLEASAEYTIPLTSFLRFAVFYDIGNVWADAFDFDTSEFASSAGAGLRLDFPGFPIRLDYAHPISEDDDYTRKRRFVFWIGSD